MASRTGPFPLFRGMPHAGTQSTAAESEHGVESFLPPSKVSMDPRTSPPRVAMYSHDTFGLGHITRTLRLARAITESVPDASVLVLTGSPIAHRLTFPRRVEYIKLPSVRKRGPEEYVSRELSIPFWRLRRMRLQIIRDTLRLFRPHILFVDNVPLGMKGEILPALLE